MTDDAWRPLASTYKLQAEVYDINLPITDPDELGAYISWNATAIAAELGEFLAEIPSWKPWVTNKRMPTTEERDRAVGELIDIEHFVNNQLCALGVTDEEHDLRYQSKQQVNRDRQASGTYTGTNEKCPHCHRDLEEVEIIISSGKRHCGGCGAYLEVRT